jgi:hypothetical protein
MLRDFAYFRCKSAKEIEKEQREKEIGSKKNKRYKGKGKVVPVLN